VSLRFPSVAIAWQRARETLQRFPLALLSTLAAMGLVLYMIDASKADWHPRLLATLILGLVLFTAAASSAERRGVPPRRRWITDACIALALALLYLASLGWTDRLAFLRFVQLLVVAHLFAAVAPYLAPGGLRGFWQFNRFLFLRFLVATLHALVLWVGLAVALAALDKLFGVHVASERYAQLMAVLVFGFHPWFFLSGVPRDYEQLEVLEDYPTGLKVFTQYVLIPLVAIYLVILTAYLGKVLITRSWPSGWIGYLVSSVSLTGVLALLLVHPIRQREDSRWVKAYGRWWFVALLPALAMLLLAVTKRMGQYGVTEPRYFLLVLGLWLLGLALYYIWSGSDNIKLIPVSLGVVAALTTLGPWGAYAVSKRSQTARFSSILAANGMGKAGAPSRAAGVVSLDDRRELSAILRYLEETHGPESVAQVMGVSADSVRAWRLSDQGGSDDPIAARGLGLLGVAHVNRWERAASGDYFWGNYSATRGLEVTGFDVTRTMSYPSLGWIGSAADSVELKAGPGETVAVAHAGAVVLTLEVGAAIHAALPEDSLTRRGSGPLAAPIVIEGSGGGIRVRWVLDQVGGKVAAGRLELQNANGVVLVGGLQGSAKQ
jgi:hypothetical protein